MKIKSLFIVLGLVFTGLNSIHSQSRLDNKNILSLGFGAGTISGFSYSAFYSVNKNFKTENFGPIYLKYERCLTDKFSLGVSLSYVEIKGSWSGSNSSGYFILEDSHPGFYNLSSTSINMRFNWIMYRNDKLDVYFGTGAGYRYNKYSEQVYLPYGVLSQEEPYYIPLSLEASFGIRYFLSDNIGLYSEIGIAKSIFQAGIVVGFK